MIWLNPEQLKTLGVSKGILHRNRRLWTWRSTGRRGANGREIEEVLLESMPETWQRKWLEGSRESDGALTTEFVSPPENVLGELDDGGDGLDTEIWQKAGVEDRLTEALVRYAPDVRDSLLNEAQRLASITERYDGIAVKRRRPSGKPVYEYVPEVLDLCAEAACTDPKILAIEPSRAKAKSPHTLEAWAKQYRTDGLSTFLRKPPEPTGKVDKRRAQISAAALEWINANIRKHPSPRKLYQRLKAAAERNGWAIPSEGWIWRKYDELPAIVKTLWFEGQKSYTGKHAPFVPRDARDLGALQVLVGDHSNRDVTVMMPSGELIRPWLTIWQDIRTGLIWGWHLDTTPSSVTIGLAYANGVQTFGAQPPADPNTGYQSYLYTDQGKDYKGKTIAGQTLPFKHAARIEGGLSVLCSERRVGLIDDLGLKHILARGYNAREKFVERTHKDISEWEKNTFDAEYCGNGKTSKPERWQTAWNRHQRLLKKIGMHSDWLRSESPFMTLEDYRDAISGWITEYNHAEHQRSVLGGARVIPVREYERLYPTRYEISEQALAMLLMRADRRKIGKNGVQYFQPHWYFLHEAMSEFKGEEVEIRYNDNDWSRVWAILPDRRIVEAEMVGNSGVINPNKSTMGIVARQKAHEQKLQREYQVLAQSNWRNETTEDRVNAMLGNDKPDEPEERRIAVNDRPSVPVIGRFDRPPTASSRHSMNAEQIDGLNVIEGMFGDGGQPKPRIKEEWED